MDEAALQAVHEVELHADFGLEAPRLWAAARAGRLAGCVAGCVVWREGGEGVLGFVRVVGRVGRQTEDGTVEVEADVGAEAEDDGGLVGLPSLVAGISIAGDQLVALDAAPALVVASHDDAAGKAGVGEPDLVPWEEPARMVGPEQFQEAGTGIRGGDELRRNVALHVELPEMVVDRVSVEGAACFGDVDQVSGR